MAGEFVALGGDGADRRRKFFRDFADDEKRREHFVAAQKFEITLGEFRQRSAPEVRALGVKFLEIDAEKKRLHTKGRKEICGISGRLKSGLGF